MSDRKNAISELYRETEAARALLAAFADALGEDAEAKAGLIEGETNLVEVLHACVERLAELKGLQAGIKAQADALKARKERYEGQEERLRAAMLSAMGTAGLQRLEAPLGTISRKAVAPSVHIIDESLVPAVFWRRADPAIEKRALLAALKEGEQVPGATLSNGGQSLQVRLS